MRWEIQSLGTRLAQAVANENEDQRNASASKQQSLADDRLAGIISDMKRLLNRIEDAVPLINLAITTSGNKLSTTLPSTVSPSRLLQASTFLSAADTQYALGPTPIVQVGPTFTLSLYMLFSGHSHRPQDEDAVRETTWQEAIHKARVKLLRVPLDKVHSAPTFNDDRYASGRSSNPINEAASISAEGKAYEFAYQLLLIEDLDDDRVHTFEEGQPHPGPYDDIPLAGIREAIPIHQISKIFYADTGKILNIGTEGETNNPVLLLKRDINAQPPRRMMDQTAENDIWEYNDDDSHDTENPINFNEDQSDIDAQICRDSSLHQPPSSPPPQDKTDHAWRLPSTLDPEWVALEVYTEEQDSESEDDDISISTATSRSQTPSARQGSAEPNVTTAMAHLALRNASSPPHKPHDTTLKPNSTSLLRPQSNGLPVIKTSLSLLEMLVRLTSLQQFQQASHLSITDELLTFFLEESSTTGAGADGEMRQRVRRDARRRVGFDPYDESPIKRRGEEYLYQQSEHNDYNAGNQHFDAASARASYYRGSPSVRSSPAPEGEGSPWREGTPASGDPAPFSYVQSIENVHSRSEMSKRPYSSPPPQAQERARDQERQSLAGEPAAPGGRKVPGFASNPATPNKSRSAALRHEAGAARRTRSSPLGRENGIGGSGLDSGLGTSPSSENLSEVDRGA